MLVYKQTKRSTTLKPRLSTKGKFIDNHGQKAKKEGGELLFNKEKPLLNFFLAGLLNHCTL